MTAPILPSNVTIPAIAPSSPSVQLPGSSPGAFQSAFADAVAKVETFQNNAQASVERFLSGEGEELHHVAITAQQAELSFQLFLQVRNKIVTAYQQMMQMQI